MTITTTTLIHWLRRAATFIREHREMLTALDAAIGDADHGVNLDRGFTAVVAALPAHQGSDAGALLKSAGLRLISTVGGASGPLYGTAFRRAGRSLEGYTSVGEYELLAALIAFRDGIAAMGKAELGDKTMIDAITPALVTFERCLNAHVALHDALHEAAFAAQQGAEGTVPLVARRGRASYLGERSAGHQDPGATSAALIFRALAEVVAET